MEAFNLEEALKGAPVVLRNGKKAIVGYKIPHEYLNGSETIEPLQGYTLDLLNTMDEQISWQENGKYWSDCDHDLDIIGMWEETRQIVTIHVPAPLLSAPKPQEKYYAVYCNNGGGVSERTWWNSDADIMTLQNGLAFASYEDAKAAVTAFSNARA